MNFWENTKTNKKSNKETPAMNEAEKLFNAPERVEILEMTVEEHYKELLDRIEILEKVLADNGIKITLEGKIDNEKSK